jgi:hypothetical protein
VIRPDDPLQAALDAALARALLPPALPMDFSARLRAALARMQSTGDRRVASRAQAEREQRERLAALDADYLRLRRRTLGTLIGGAFAAGAAVAVAFPWLQAHFGAWAVYLLAGVGALVGIGIGSASWIGRLPIVMRLARL